MERKLPGTLHQKYPFARYRVNRTVVYIIALSVFIFIHGCNNEIIYINNNKLNWCEDFIIPQDKLPPGWVLVPDSEMPLSGELHWWEKNPQLFAGDELEKIREYIYPERGRLTKTTRFFAATYWKETEDKYSNIIVLFAKQYSSKQDAQAEFKLMSKTIDDGNPSFIGYARKYNNTLLFLGIQRGSADQDFFINVPQWG